MALWSLFLLLLTASASTCQQHSRNHAQVLLPSHYQKLQKHGQGKIVKMDVRAVFHGYFSTYPLRRRLGPSVPLARFVCPFILTDFTFPPPSSPGRSAAAAALVIPATCEKSTLFFTTSWEERRILQNLDNLWDKKFRKRVRYFVWKEELRDVIWLQEFRLRNRNFIDK